ncbi:class III extradiol ring-cleavage dioxygenase [Massilia sp. IC2-476]|uniref:DODA-type extradiol aromatic ring-opening family dioxygenase n=1 Tax=Massilia sp. IC2-476 TaxID=2887199 RepID=UPI001D10F3E1|nr:class III extradiol ring-cleavage dioxygenase [Massilia sp. IC2-476]MCC2971983.1 dioxygenase [Massilia sp. IC2-476]
MRLPTYFVSHGGGPWPWMKDQYGPAYAELEASLVGIRQAHGEAVRAVLVVTSHWETPGFMVSSGGAPGMIYDYGGFPPHTYQVQYPAPGNPALAQRVAALLGAGGHPVGLDAERGFDHGTFSMLYPVYPEARMPVVQLSLRRDLDPQAHIEAGRALAPLRDEGVLILGSGLSFHNLRQFGPSGAAASKAFDGWLQQTMTLAPPERTAALLRWETAPMARAAHPREEHLLPLMVALGAAEQEPAACVYHEEDFFGSLTVSSFRFGGS